MKPRKSVLLLLILLLLCGGTATAQSSNITPKAKPKTGTTSKPKPQEYNIYVEGSTSVSRNLDALGGTIRLGVSTNASSWYLERHDISWISARKEDGVVVIDVYPNKEIYSRSGEFHVVAEGKAASITIKQSGAPYYLTIAGNSKADQTYTLSPEKGNSWYLIVKTNAPNYKVDSKPYWVTLKKSSTPDTLRFDVDINTYSYERTGTMVIKAGDKTINILLKQPKMISSYLLVNDSKSDIVYEVDAKGGSSVFSVATNETYYSVVDDPYWVYVLNKRDKSFLLEIKPNTTSSPRTAILRVKAGDHTIKITCRQAAGPAVQPSTKTEPPKPQPNPPQPKPKEKTRHAVDWSWNLDRTQYCRGFTFGYTNNCLKAHTTDGDYWRGDYAWGKQGHKLHGAQVGFHLQRYTNWTVGIGVYTGAIFSFYHSWNKDTDYNYFKEYSAMVPLHLYIQIPVITHNLAILAHGGPDLTYFWGGIYKDTKGDYISYSPDYNTILLHRDWNVGISVAVGFRYDDFQMEVMTSRSFQDNFQDLSGITALLQQFSIRISYLFSEPK